MQGEEKNWDRASRDLLIELKTEMLGVRADLRELKNDLTLRVARLEEEKHDKDEAERHLKENNLIHNDQENRIRRLERYGFMAIGGLMLLEVILRYILK